MSTLTIVLRVLCVAAFVGPMLLLRILKRHDRATAKVHQSSRDRAPLIANLAAVGVYVVSVLMSPGTSTSVAALPLALAGSVLALTGAGLIFKARIELGRAWHFLAETDATIGLVTTGPYRLVRHPIYLGLTLIAAGTALAFSCWAGLCVVVCGMVPTFAWRACREERLLSRTFGERYEAYRQQTKIIVPLLL